MGELASALDAVGALASEDLFGLSDGDLLDRSRDLVRARNQTNSHNVSGRASDATISGGDVRRESSTEGLRAADRRSPGRTSGR